MSDQIAQRQQAVDWLTYVLGLVQRADQLTKQKAATIARPPGGLRAGKATWGVGWYFLWVLMLTVAYVIVAQIVASIFGFFGVRSFGLTTFLLLLPLPLALLTAGIPLYLRARAVREPNREVALYNAEAAARSGVEKQSEVARIQAEYSQVGGELRNNVLGHYPKEYLHEDALQFCIGVIRNHRANSLTEALNLYETELHRQRMVNLAQAQVDAAQYANSLAMINNVINAAGHAATANAVRAEGAATRANQDANALYYGSRRRR